VFTEWTQVSVCPSIGDGMKGYQIANWLLLATSSTVCCEYKIHD